MKTKFFTTLAILLYISTSAQEYAYVPSIDMTFEYDSASVNATEVSFKDPSIYYGDVRKQLNSSSFWRRNVQVDGEFDRHYPEPHGTNTHKIRCKENPDKVCVILYVPGYMGISAVDPNGGPVSILLNDGLHTRLDAVSGNIESGTMVLTGAVNEFTDSENGAILDNWLSQGAKAWPPFDDGSFGGNYEVLGEYSSHIEEQSGGIITVTINCNYDPTQYCYFYTF